MAVALVTTGTYQIITNPSSPFTALTLTAGAGSDRLLLLFIGVGKATPQHTTASPTYGGQTMTQIGSGATNTTWVATEAWYLLETGIAAAGSTTFSISPDVSGGGSNQFGCNGIVLTGVDQTTPIDTGTIQTQNGSGTTCGVTVAIASGNMGVATFMSDNESGLQVPTGTSLYITPDIGVDTVHAAQYSTTAGSTLLQYNHTSGFSNGRAVLGFEVHASGSVAGLSVMLAEPELPGSYF